MADSSHRQIQKQYWEMHSEKPTIDSMMLDSGAKDIDQLERPEILSLLPSFRENRVIELGAGIGRFTGVLADKAKHVVAVDFMQSNIDANREAHDEYSNIDFVCEDAVELKLPSGEFDLVFSNWLLMYLNDGEAATLLHNALKWLRPGGHLFFRESCFRPSGNAKRTGGNPTHYRNPTEYDELLRKVYDVDDTDGVEYTFNVLKGGQIEAYMTLKNNPNQRYWKCIKVPSDSVGDNATTYQRTGPRPA